MALRHFLLLFLISVLGAEGKIITLENKCNTNIWPGFLIFGETSQPGLDNSFELRSGESTNITAPSVWAVIIWGRNGCSFDSSGNGRCVTGDCGALRCDGARNSKPPSTAAIITLYPDLVEYAVTLEAGFNIPMSIEPYGHRSSECQVASCLSDLNRICPPQMQVRFNGKTVACKGDCQTFNKPQFCCSGLGNETCITSSYWTRFKAACPKAGINGVDLAKNMFRCTAAHYKINFC